MKFNITCNTDNNYVQHCCVMLCSLFENNRDVEFNVYVLANNLSQSNKSVLIDLGARYRNNIYICAVDEEKLKGVQFRKVRPLTCAAYYRILLPEILESSIDKVLYLDCDVVVIGSVKELFDIEINDFAVAACADVSPYNDAHRNQLGLDVKDRAFCTGVMLINLAYWRQNNVVADLLSFAKRPRDVVYLHDQDALNYVFKRKWFKLPYKWNKTPRSIVPLDIEQKSFDRYNYAFDARIVHYASSVKPWTDVWFPERKYYMKYLAISGYPNPVINHIELKNRVKEYVNNTRYLLNRFIRPFVPKIAEIALCDLADYMYIVFHLVFKPRGLKRALLHLWLKRNGLRD